MTTKPTILIVDDAPENIEILASCLVDSYQVKVTTQSKRCLDLACSEPIPDLILLDILMPDMDGYEVCRKLKEHNRSSLIPIIFVSGLDKEMDEELGLNIGAVDYITKPISPSIVRARVKTHITLKQQYDQLQKMALHDQLTGLYNRYHLMDVSSKIISSTLRHNTELSLIMVDIDHFKVINDQHGHSAGDKVLQEVSSVIKKNCRNEDTLVRYGGEEFVILLDQCGIDEAAVKAEILRASVEQLKPHDLTVTISLGVTQYTASDTGIEDLLRRADTALYQAKGDGRNRVCSQASIAKNPKNLQKLG